MDKLSATRFGEQEMMEARRFVRDAQSRPHYSLNQYFYQSPFIYQREIKHILLKSWIYAGHVSEIASPGDYLTFGIGTDSIIVVRDRDLEIHALANTCRHRGARVCLDERGHQRTLTCPYHAWVYALDGQLIKARDMGPDFNEQDISLRKLRCCVIEGMIFVNCDQEASDFKSITSEVLPQLRPYRLDQAKVATRKSYQIMANWKLSLENYLECYHCAPSHKAYSKAHTFSEDSERVTKLNQIMLQRATDELRLGEDFTKPVRKQYSDEPAFGSTISHLRYALFEGYDTGTLDGTTCAPLMGDFATFDGGAGDFQFGPVSAMLNYPDYCVIYRFLPLSIQRSEIEVVWLVKDDATEGVDYDLDRLTEMWDVTTKEDELIILRNQEGINSSMYVPGPRSQVFEQLNINFTKWYLKALDLDT